MRTVTTNIGVDKTDYARSIGYTGKKPVIVSDGKVISHSDCDWFVFCSNIEKAVLRHPSWKRKSPKSKRQS